MVFYLIVLPVIRINVVLIFIRLSHYNTITIPVKIMFNYILVKQYKKNITLIQLECNYECNILIMN